MNPKTQRILHKLLCLCAIFTMASCTDKCNDEYFVVSINFSGTVNVEPAEVTQGDDVVFTIRNNINNTYYGNDIGTTINDEYIIKSISYFIEGKKVAESSDRYDSFKANFNTSDLTPGTYVVTARCNSNFEDFENTGQIVEGELTVLPN